MIQIRTLLSTFLFLCLSLSLFSQTQVGTSVNGPEAAANLGWSVALSTDGKVAAVGAFGMSPTGPFSGQVNVYAYKDNGAWKALGKPIKGENGNSMAGQSVALSGNGEVVAVGSHGNNSAGLNGGQVQVYQLKNGNWSQMGKDIQAKEAGEHFGTSISISEDGKKLLVGLPGAWSKEGRIGKARVFEWNGGAWAQIGEDLVGDQPRDFFGAAVSIAADGSRIAVGARAKNTDKEAIGQVTTYDWDGTSWKMVGTPIVGSAEKDNFGQSVALSANGSRLVVGAWLNKQGGHNSGLSKVFDFDGGAWSQNGEDIIGESAGNKSGHSVSISDDGGIIAIGAPYKYIGDNCVGQTRIFTLKEGKWMQHGVNINGEGHRSHFGHATDLSGNGKTIIIGAPFTSTSGLESGQFQVYSVD